MITSGYAPEPMQGTDVNPRITRAQIQTYADLIKAMMPAFQKIAQAAVQVSKQFMVLAQAIEASKPKDRPAWQSPYGPPQRRR